MMSRLFDLQWVKREIARNTFLYNPISTCLKTIGMFSVEHWIFRHLRQNVPHKLIQPPYYKIGIGHRADNNGRP